MTSDQDMIVSEAVGRFNRTIDAIEARCMAVDGPVTPTLREMQEDELAGIWRDLQTIRAALRPKEAGQAEAWLYRVFLHELTGEPTWSNWGVSVGPDDPTPSIGGRCEVRPLYASPPPTSPAVTVGVKPDAAAAKRILAKLAKEGGGTWAAYMWIEIEEAFAMTSPAGETAQVEATDDITVRLDNLAQSLAGEYPPHTLMDLAEAASLITTLRKAARRASPSIFEGEVEAAARAVFMEEYGPKFDFDFPDNRSMRERATKAARAALSASSLSAKESPEQLREPAAWMTDDGRVASDETRRTAMHAVSKAAFHIPLYRDLPLSTGGGQ